MFLNIAEAQITVASKQFTENYILSEILALLLENKGIEVVRKNNLGGTKVAFEALVHDEIHVYPDYTGTGYGMILKMSGERKPERVYKIVANEFEKKWGIHWSKTLGFNNTYALTVRKDDDRFKGMTKISELVQSSEKFRYAAPYEFMERNDGHKAFVKFYGLKFKPQNILSMEAGLMYTAIKEKQTDMIVNYSTDGRIKSFHLRSLEDDLGYFPPYQVAYLYKAKKGEEIPELVESIESLQGMITASEMTELNYLVDGKRMKVKDVAYNFLIEKKLIDGQIKMSKNADGLFAYFIQQKSYLFKLLKEHCILSFGALFFATLFSLPIGILLTRSQKLSSMVFPIINILQTIPSLALLGFLIPILGIGFSSAIFALFLYSLLPLIRNTYEGIKGIDKSFIEASRGLGLTNLQILLKVEIPLALPFIIAGIRTASAIVIGTATLAALIGAGGFGDPIFRGVATVNNNLILLGAIPAAVFAVIVDKAIAQSEKILVSKGIRLKRSR